MHTYFHTDQCTLQPETGLCRAYIPSYYWNVVTRKCEKFIYGGCGGNSNRFSTVEQCESACKRSKILIVKFFSY